MKIKIVTNIQSIQEPISKQPQKNIINVASQTGQSKLQFSKYLDKRRFSFKCDYSPQDNKKDIIEKTIKTTKTMINVLYKEKSNYQFFAINHFYRNKWKNNTNQECQQINFVNLLFDIAEKRKKQSDIKNIYITQKDIEKIKKFHDFTELFVNYIQNQMEQPEELLQFLIPFKDVISEDYQKHQKMGEDEKILQCQHLFEGQIVIDILYEINQQKLNILTFQPCDNGKLQMISGLLTMMENNLNVENFIVEDQVLDNFYDKKKSKRQCQSLKKKVKDLNSGINQNEMQFNEPDYIQNTQNEQILENNSSLLNKNLQQQKSAGTDGNLLNLSHQIGQNEDLWNQSMLRNISEDKPLMSQYFSENNNEDFSFNQWENITFY